MKIKKKYKVGDTCWIYGIGNNKSTTKATVVHALKIPGYVGEHYIVAVQTAIEDLLEVRTWHNISQDEKGPVGSFREVLQSEPPTVKFLYKIGINLDEGETEQDNNNEPNSSE